MADFAFICVRDTILITILIIISINDLREYLIPDKWIVVTIINWLVWELMLGESISVMAIRILGSIAVAGVLLVVVILADKAMNKESLGGGDIKLIFATALYLGTWNSIYMILIACLIGLIFFVVINDRVKGELGYFPFGPAISLATMIMLLSSGWIDMILGYARG